MANQKETLSEPQPRPVRAEGSPLEHQQFYQHLQKVYKKPEDYELAGKENAYVRIDAQKKVTGAAIYAGDVILPGMLYGKIKRSPYAHAKIISINTSRAEALPGVKCVITGKDFHGAKLGNPEAFKEMADKDPLCKDEVRLAGDEVAAVAAVDEETAWKALDLIEVVYERLPAVFDPLEAKNTGIFTTMLAGDPDKAFAEADFTDKHHYRTQMVAHAAIEPHSTVAKYENNEWTVWTST
ncbi:MAG: molybdopterin-dependent oxidoreductase, partial [Treponema sp.]|nr:molybdopterin-dependent oxidoreductase [Treponema sp.]